MSLAQTFDIPSGVPDSFFVRYKDELNNTITGYLRYQNSSCIVQVPGKPNVIIPSDMESCLSHVFSMDIDYQVHSGLVVFFSKLFLVGVLIFSLHMIYISIPSRTF